MIVTDLAGPVPFKVVANIEYPDKFRVDADMPGGRVAQVYSQGRYWVIDPGGKVGEMPEEGRPQIKASVQRDMIAVLVKAAAGQLVVREVDSDEPALAALEISGSDMAPLTLFIHRDNGLIDRARYEGPDGRVEERYDDEYGSFWPASSPGSGTGESTPGGGTASAAPGCRSTTRCRSGPSGRATSA